MRKRLFSFSQTMLILILLFAFRIYGIEIEVISPEQGSANNPVNTYVEFNVISSNDTIDVDVSSVEIDINGTIYYDNSNGVEYTYTGGAGLSYNFVVQPASSFAYGDSVHIIVNAADLQGIETLEHSWYFWVIDDNIAPLVYDRNPNSGATDVELDVDIMFSVRDLLSGVDINSVSLHLETTQSGLDATYQIGAQLTYQTIANGYRFTLDTENDFVIADTVMVTVAASDNAGNEVISSYTFYIKTSLDYTYTGNWEPYPGQQNVSVNSTVGFNIYNMVEDIYVDTSTIVVRVQGQQYTHASLGHFEIEPINTGQGVNMGYQVTVLPYNAFSYNQLVTVWIDADDTEGNHMERFIYTFRTINDVAGPYITSRSPARNETGVSVDTDIYFQIKDVLSGVDTTSVQVWLDSLLFEPIDEGFTYGIVADGYSVTILPPLPFGSLQEVNITISASDNLGNTLYDSYNFTTELSSVDTTPPFLWDIYPENGAVNMPLDTEISFYVYDFDPGVNPGSIRLYKNGQNVTGGAEINADPAFGTTELGYYRAYHVTYQLNESVAGTINWSVRAEDYIGNIYNEGYDEVFTFTCVASAPPYINLPSEFVFLEDGVLVVDFADYAGDPDGGFPELTHTVTSNIIIAIAGSEVTFSAPLNWNGTETVTFYVEDGSGGTASDAVLVRVLPVNDPPTINLPVEGFTLNEDTSQEIDFADYVYDVDGDVLLLQATGQDSVIIVINNLMVTISSVPDYFGTEDVTFTVYDSSNRLSASQTIPITFDPMPDQPAINLPDYILMVEDEVEIRDFGQYIYDPEGMAITLAVAVLDSNQVNVSISGTVVTLTPAANWHGDDVMTFMVRYQGQSWVEGNTTVRVLSVNDPPSMNLPASVSVDEDSELEIDFGNWVSDVDGDPIFLSYFGNQNITVSVDSLLVTLVPDADWNGTEVIYFVAQDPFGASISGGLNVIVNPMNDEPVIAFPPYFEFYEDTLGELDLGLYITDIDGDELEIIISGNTNISYELTGMLLTFSTPEDWFGVEILSFEVADGAGGEAASELEVRVINVNDPPELSLPESINFDEDSNLEINFAAQGYVSDPDGDAITLYPSGNNKVIAQIVGGSIVLLSAEPNWNGSEVVTFLATDGNGGINSGTTTVIVNPVNDTPTINLPGSFTFAEGTTLDINLAQYVHDVDLNDLNSGEELTISSSGHENVTIAIDGLNVSFGSVPQWNGEEIVTFTVTDFEGLSASDNVQVTVSIWQNNHAPELIEPLEIQSFEEDGSLVIDFVGDSLVYDIDGDDLLVTVINSTNILAVEAGSVVTFTATPDWNGTETIGFLVNDQHGGYVQGELTFLVTAVDDLTIFELPDNFLFEEGSYLIRDLRDYVTELDGDPLTMDYWGNENILIDIVSQPMTIRLQAAAGWTGSETVIFEIDDGITPVTDSVEVEVILGSGNYPPQFVNLPGSFIFDEDTSFTFDFEPHIFDLNAEDEFVLTVSRSSSYMHCQVNGLEIVIVPNGDWNGSDWLGFTVYDTSPSGSRAHATANISVTVNPVNDPPTINLPEYFTFEENTELTLNFINYINDVDSGIPSLGGASGDNIFINILGTNVTFSATPDWFGSEIIHFWVSDGEYTANDSLEIIVTESTWNHAPEIVGLPDSVRYDEDTQLVMDFNPYVIDEDGDNWLITFSANDYIGATVNENNVVTFRSELNWHGQQTMNFIIWELRSRVQVPGSILVIVDPVNDAPTINLPSEFRITENSELIEPFLPYIHDVDGDVLTLQVTGNNNIAVIIYPGNVVHFTPPVDWLGTETITFTVSDGELNNSDIVDVIVEQGDFNHAPEINLPATITLDEDTQLEIDFSEYVSDVDGDDLVLTHQHSELILVVIDGLMVTFIPSLNWHGYEDIDFTVWDSRGSRASATDEVRVIVNSVNDVPELDLPATFTFEEDGELVINFGMYMYDADGDFLTITWEGNENVIITRDAYVITLSSTGGWSGSEMIEFRATDPSSASAVDTVEVIVSTGHFNHEPEINLPDSLEMYEDEITEFDFEAYISDEDGDDLVLSASYNANLGVSIAGSMVTFYPAHNYNGTIELTFTVWDTQGFRASASDEVLIIVIPVNDPPTINLPERFTFSNSSPYIVNFSPFISDPDGESLVITYSGNDEIEVNVESSIVIFSADEEFSGTEGITFTVTDGAGENASDLVLVQAISGSTNTPPEINLPDYFEFEEDGSFEVDFLAAGYVYDIDDDPLTLLAYGNDNVIIQITGTLVTLTAEPDWNGSEDVTFYVFDDMGRETASGEVEVIVTPVNDPPVIILPPEGFSFVEGEELSNIVFSNYITDVDTGDVVTLSVEENININVSLTHLPGNVIIGDISSVLGFIGQETLTFTVTDAIGAEGSDSAIITVLPGDYNHAPVMDLPAEISIAEDTEYWGDFAEYIEDVDGDDIVLTVANVSNMDIYIEGLEVTIIPDANWFGNTNITFTAYDTVGRASVSDVVNFIVRAQNDAPELYLPEYIFFEEDSVFELNFDNYMHDIDGDDLSISWEGNENIIIGYGAGNNILFSEDDFIGIESIIFTITDDSLATASNTMQVEVIAGQWNHAPQIELPEQFIITEDIPEEFDFGQYISDDDDDSLLIMADYNEYISVQVNSDTLVTLYPAENYAGSTILTFHVIDNILDRAIASASVEIVVLPVNDPPTINLPAELSMTQEEVLNNINFANYVNDVDGDMLYLTHEGSEHLAITINGLYVSISLSDLGWWGSEELTFSVWDDSLSASDSMIIRVYQGSMNEPPEINLPDNFTFAEDGSMVIDFLAEGYISDPEGDELTLTVSGTHHVIVEIAGTVVTIAAEPDWNGSEEIVFYVFDDIDDRSTAFDEVMIIVTPVNDAPVIDLPPSFTKNEDALPTYLNLTPYIYDIDSPYLQLSISGQENLILSVIEESFYVSVNRTGNWVGEETITFSVYDGYLTSVDSALVIIEPGAENHPPTINLPDELTLLEDDPTTYNFSSYVHDVDGDDLVLSTGNYTNILIDINQLNVTITPALNWNGSRNVEFTVYDTQGRASASDNVTIIIQPVNDPPVINFPPAVIFEENSQHQENFSQYVSDVDGDILSLSWDATEIINITNQGLVVYFSAPESWYGEEYIQFHVSDGITAAHDSLLVIVEQGDWNHDPEFVLPDGWVMAEDTQLAVDFAPYMWDIDEDELFLSFIPNANIGININGTEVTFTPAANYHGLETLEFRVVDIISGRGMVSDTAVLEVTPVNDPPTIVLPDEFGFVQTAQLYKNFNRYIDDIDSDELILEHFGNNHISVEIDENFIVNFYLSPENHDWYGMEVISFRVTDDSTATATDSVQVRVYQGNINTPPVITLPATFNFLEDETLSVNFESQGYVSDEDGDDLFLTVSDNENVTVEIFGTLVIMGALPDWHGNEELTFWVIDEYGLAASDRVWVQVAAVNDAPVIDLPSGFSFQEGSFYRATLNDYFYDVDSNSFTVEYSGADQVLVDIEEYGINNVTYIVEFTAVEDWSGEELITFTIYDDDGASGSDNVLITVTPGDWNHAPEIYLPAEFSFREDEPFTFDLTEYIHDVDGDYLLIFPHESNHIGISIDPDTLVTLTPAEDWFGTETIGFTIHDSESPGRASAYGSVIVNVASVNDPPVINFPDVIEFSENTSEILNFGTFASDVETEILQIGFSGNDTINVQIQGYNIILSAPQDWTGEEVITFSATDDSLVTVYDSSLVRVIMGDWNHAPEINLPEEGFTLAEDSELEVDFSPYISDPDGDDLFLTSVQDADIGVLILGNNVIFNPAANYNGTKTLTFTVLDNIGRLQASDDVQVTVTPVNDPPTLVLPPELSLSVNTGRSVNFNSFINDIDEGDSHTLTHSGNTNIQVDIDGLWVDLYSDWVGSEWISFTVHDLQGLTATDSVRVYVFAEQANNTPTINLPDEFIFNEDQTVQIDFNPYINDVDGDDLSLLVTGNSMINANPQSNGIVIFSAAANWNGTEMLTFIVTDNYSFSLDNVNVVVMPVNDPPEINLPNSFSFPENTTLNVPFGLYISDVDGDQLTITASGNEHVNVVVIETTVQLSCSGWYGQESILFTVDDGNGETASDEVLVIVSEGASNHAPEINLPESFETNEDQVLVIDMSPYIFDLDDDQLIITVAGQQHTTVQIYVHTVYVIPDENWHGTEALIFTVIDNVMRASASASTNIIVHAVNDDPVINLPNEFTFLENSNLLLDFNQYVSDIDGDGLSLSSPGSEHINVQITNLSVVLSAAQYWSGSEAVSFTVSDGNGGYDTDNVQVLVEFVNNPPYVVLPIQNFVMDEDTTNDSINLNAVFSDHDLEYGDYLSYNWYGDTNLEVINNEGAITIIPSANWFGVESLIFRATDSYGLFVEESVTITVSSVNDPPIVVTDESLTAQADASGYANVWLDANGSYDIDGTIMSIVWTWDGGTTSGMVVQQQFEAGYYEITVQATDNQGGIGTAHTTLSVAEYGNENPIALDDYYEVYETTELIIFAGNGVLANDHDPDNAPSPLTAVLVSEPDDGILVNFGADGSFIYLAEDIVNHNVTFTYQAFDGQAYSLIGTVNITVHEIVLDDAEITINSIDTGGSTGVELNVPILTSELIPEWSVRSFEFYLSYNSGMVSYLGYNLDNALADSLGTIGIEETRNGLHCTYSSDEEITGEGALINLNLMYNLGTSPLIITEFYYNQTAIVQFYPGAINNNYPYIENAITFDDGIYEDFEAFSINLDDHFSDADGDELSYSVSFNENQIIAAINGNMLGLSSVPDWNGTTAITITATDGYTLTQPEVYTFYPVIIAVNDSPQIELPEFFSFPEDSSLVVDMTEFTSDPDYDELELSWSGNENIYLSAEGMLLTFTAEQDWWGSEIITITVDDQIRGRLIASADIEVIVTSVNDIPVLNLPISFSFDEDESLVVDFAAEGYVYDIEGDAIILSIYDNENVFASFDNTIVTLYATQDWFGNEFVTFRAHDEHDTLSVSAEIQIIVHPVNDPPVINLPDLFEFEENSTAEENTINFADSIIYDVDNEILELTVDDGEFITITIEGSIVSFEPQPNWDGSERRTFTVSDNEGRATASGSVRIYVYDSEPNQPPVIEFPAQGFTFAEDSQLTIDFGNPETPGYVYDPEGQNIFITFSGSDNITAQVLDLDVTFGAIPDYFGTDEIIITAYDFDPQSSVARDTILITVTPVNDPPEINLPDNIILLGNSTRVINFAQYLYDVDNNVNDLTLTATGNEQVDIEIYNTVVSFISPANWEGEEIVYFSVIDNGSIPSQDSLLVIVEQEYINHPPQISLPASLTFNEDEELAIDFSQYVSDPDGDELFIIASGGQNVYVEITGLEVLLSAKPDWNGNEIILFTVYDTGGRASDSEDIQINVTAVNDPPRFDPIYDFVMERDQVLEVDFGNYAYDIENDSFQLSLSIGVGLNITQIGSKFTIIPVQDCPEIQNLTLTATENTSGIYSEISFGLHVKEPAVYLEALNRAVQNGVFTFNENSGNQAVNFSEYLNADYDISLSSSLLDIQGIYDSDSLKITLENFDMSIEPGESWVGTFYLPLTVNYLYDRARRDFDLKITVRQAKSGERVTPLPHTVTWNDEVCHILIDTGEPPGTITGKILNRRGRQIRELTGSPERLGENRYEYLWYKDDDKGNPVDGGLYIYQIMIKGTAYQGTIVIVR